MSFPQYPYCEQHDPCGQLPQTVLLFAAPQVPSVVTGAEEAVGDELAEELEVMLVEMSVELLAEMGLLVEL